MELQEPFNELFLSISSEIGLPNAQRCASPSSGRRPVSVPEGVFAHRHARPQGAPPLHGGGGPGPHLPAGGGSGGGGVRPAGSG